MTSSRTGIHGASQDYHPSKVHNIHDFKLTTIVPLYDYHPLGLMSAFGADP